MSLTLPAFIADQRDRWGLQEMQTATASSASSLSSNRFARTANEQLVYLTKEAVKANIGWMVQQNQGWFLRYPELTIQDDGTLFLPPDLEKLIAVLRKNSTLTVPEIAQNHEHARRLGTDCGGYVLQGDSLKFDSSQAGSTRHVLYNTNLNQVWTASAVSSATATTLVPSQTPTYSYVPIVTTSGFYNGLEIEVTRTSGSPASQRAKIKSWNGTTFTIYGSAWPSWTPTSADSWGIVCPLPGAHLELLAYAFAQATRPTPANVKNDPSFFPRFSELKSQFYVSVKLRGEYGA